MKNAGQEGGAAGGRVISLDGIRGVAAMFVMIYHLPVIFGFNIPHAYLAVDLFFMLSGWVMAYSYEERIGQGLAFKQFALQRLARLYPLYGVALALGFSFALVKYLFGTPTAATLICLLPNSVMLPCMSEDPENFPLNRPAWSIFVKWSSISPGTLPYVLGCARYVGNSSCTWVPCCCAGAWRTWSGVSCVVLRQRM